MDIDQQGKPIDRPLSEQTDSEAEQDADSGRQIILPSEAYPNLIHVLPHDRPFFPGQAIPLIVGAEHWLSTVEAIRERGQDVVGLIATRESSDGIPAPADLFEMGTLCRIHRVHREGAQLQILLEGLQRFRVRRWLKDQPPFAVNAQYFPERIGSDADTEKAYAIAIINIIKELIPLNPLYGEELKVFLARSNPNEPSVLADFAASLTSSSKPELQEVLETVNLQRRLEKVVELLHKELQIAKAQMEIRRHVEAEIQSHQREAVLRQQLKYIQKELGIAKDDKTAEIDDFRERLESLTVPPAVMQRIEDELQKLSMLEVGSPEYGVTRNYLDWLTSVPWGLTSDDARDLEAATRTLNRHHEGLEDVKERILEFLALGIMKGQVAGSIICFVGPPGVGKTSLGRAIAAALERKFYRFSVGGMRDEAEIKGHRRTYIGAMPGKLVQALKDTRVVNPVVMLDEVDKIGASFQGDPASALLEVLDPEQNSSFHDHYLDVDLDLSRVLFVCTANQLDTIPGPLLDRMEVIHLSGYLDKEKLAIARRHLLPRQLERAGLKRRGDLTIEAAALRQIVEGYSREAGVRRLDKALAAIVRKAVMKLLKGAQRPLVVKATDVSDYLGRPLYEKELRQKGVGVVTGLAWTALGGATLPVEATRVHSRSAGFQLTGQLGEVMQESANIAYSHLIANADALGVPAGYFDKAFIHLHVPAGATPKDGPSAGITIASALLSLARARQPRINCAMTGELTLTGHVYPIGGVREKLLAARRQKIRTVILPAANERDYEEVPEHIRKGIKVHFVKDFEEVAELIF
ncbi:MAG: endopeptidase La [Pseudomonadales bacterium]|nr:endopeptidase La [Pseudomonadales bacterium]